MSSESTIYIRAYDDGYGCYSVSVESVIIIYIYEICESNSIDLVLQILQERPNDFVKLNISHLVYFTKSENELPKMTTYCTWPIITVDNYIVAGLSAVARQIIKSSMNKNVQHLLGFRQSCLMACSEVSIWTMFCEIDMPNSLKIILNSINFQNFEISIPNSIARFEYHLKQPVRIHNMYKVASKQNNQKISVDTLKTALNISHTFAEGPSITISDMILYPCIHIIFKLMQNSNLADDFPLTYMWYKNVQKISEHKINVLLEEVPINVKVSVDDNFLKESLYRSDMSYYKVEKKMYTKQANIEKVLNTVNTSSVEIINTNLLYGSKEQFDWGKIPILLNPCGGSLPAKRADRKCHQLESMAKSTLHIVGNSEYTIVDFCSGSGHLGLLLAYLLPKCFIILVENKEKSLARARETVSNLRLENVAIVQSNLDYFCATFDVGVSLHACGTATDLVMKNCIENEAHFICCPCCYGGVKNCHLIDYPRSPDFSSISELTYKDYLSLAHAADQTHDSENVKTEQGYLCMDIIDTDRKLFSEKFGYITFLGKLQPTTCTNKNNVIVGIRTDHNKKDIH